MKKSIYFAATLLLAIIFNACNDKDEVDNLSELENKFFTIENGSYSNEAIPAATINKTLDNIDMSTQAMSGAMNYITVFSDKRVSKFFVGIKGIEGHFEYVPDNTSTSDSPQNLKTYVIPVMMSSNYNSNSTIILNCQLDNGEITNPVEKQIVYIETMPGAIEIKLAFSNSKDIDLHLYTPSGKHIYYNNRGGSFTSESGEVISYGLDIDSNAACHLDNINKENIYIPEELVEEGTYKVVVNMYENCRPSLATSWSVIARYKGSLILPVSGGNPASGLYQEGAGTGDMTQVMTFTVWGGTISRSDTPSDIRKNWRFTPTHKRESDLLKAEFEEI